jgi:hypothetical protein
MRNRAKKKGAGSVDDQNLERGMRENNPVSGGKPPQGRLLARLGDAKMGDFVHIRVKTFEGRSAFVFQRRQNWLVQITARLQLFLFGNQNHLRHARNLIVNRP